MQMHEIADTVTKVNQAWAQHKQVDNQKTKEIERKGAADPLHNEQLNKINNDLDEY